MFCFCKMVFKCYLPNKLPQNDHFCVCVCVCVCIQGGERLLNPGSWASFTTNEFKFLRVGPNNLHLGLLSQGDSDSYYLL